MLPDVTLPASLPALLAVFAPCFTTPSFRTFCALACGFLGQTGKRTVCGMLTGAGLSRIWPHDRAALLLLLGTLGRGLGTEAAAVVG